MSETSNNENLVNNSNQPQTTTEIDILKELNLKTVDQPKGGQTFKPMKEKVLESIKKELEILDDRKTLELETIGFRTVKRKDGWKQVPKLENRFWKNDKMDNSKVLLNIKVNGRIFPLGDKSTFDSNKPTYIQVEKNIKSVKSVITQLRDKLESLDENHLLFNQHEEEMSKEQSMKKEVDVLDQM